LAILNKINSFQTLPNGGVDKKRSDCSKVQRKKAEASPKGKLTYGEKKELEQIEGKIGELETELQQLNHSLESSGIAQNPDQLQLVCSQVALIENRIERAYLRWEELEKSSAAKKKQSA